MPFASLLLVAYLYGAREQLRNVNLDVRTTDQSAYLEYAKAMRESGYRHVGDRNRMPLYPFLQSLAYRPGMTDAQFFERAKAVNVGLSIVLLGVIFATLVRYLAWADAATVVLVTAFTVFVYKAAYVQCELLFYTLNFLLFLTLLELSRKPRLRVALCGGLVAALAHLTKASVLPGVAVGLTCAAFHFVIDLVDRTPQGSPRLSRGKRLLETALSLAVFCVVFLVALYPYIRTSHIVFGRYFYNVNSTFYVWYDSWEQVERGTKAHGDRAGWPQMPPDQIPGPRKYLREHTASQMAWRLIDGLRVLAKKASDPYGYAEYVGVYAAFLVLLTLQNLRVVRTLLAADRRWIPASFFAAYCLVYTGLYAWYTPIADGNRLPLAQFLPVLFVLSYVLSRSPISVVPLRVLGQEVPGRALGRFVLLALLTDIALRYPFWISSMYGGE